jgi:hypothetical protein
MDTRTYMRTMLHKIIIKKALCWCPSRLLSVLQPCQPSH